MDEHLNDYFHLIISDFQLLVVEYRHEDFQLTLPMQSLDYQLMDLRPLH